mgnify:CR=1 FL=1
MGWERFVDWRNYKDGGDVMYQSYWINVNSGQLLRCSDPQDEPYKWSTDWDRINYETYSRYMKVIEFAINHQRK